MQLVKLTNLIHAPSSSSSFTPQGIPAERKQVNSDKKELGMFLKEVNSFIHAVHAEQ